MSAKFFGSAGINCVGAGIGVVEGVGVEIGVVEGVGIRLGCFLATATPLFQTNFPLLLIHVYFLLW